MNEYAILCHPGQNRVYFESTRHLFLNEFAAVARSFVPDAQSAENRTVGSVPYIIFGHTGKPSAAELISLARLSFFYALFELRKDMGGPALLPVDMPEAFYFPEGMSAMLKYAGKTNERFTRMMVNLALSCLDTGNGGTLHLLDPMCGKGTTLFEGLSFGFDASGVEIVPSLWHEAKTFLVKYLENGRYKHKASGETVSAEKGRKIADVFSLQTAACKEAYDAGDMRTVRLVNGDTRLAAQFFKKESFDLLVTDLPYGVQHAGRKAGGGKAEAEGKFDTLLDEALPGWVRLMKPGGAAVLSFNEYTLKKTELAALLEKRGLRVMREAPYADFRHRVDQGINRDLVAAVKPRA